MKDHLKRINLKVMEFFYLRMETNTKVILKMVFMMVLANIKLFNKDFIKVILKMGSIMEKAHSIGEMVINIQDNIKMEQETDQELLGKKKNFMKGLG